MWWIAKIAVLVLGITVTALSAHAPSTNSHDTGAAAIVVAEISE